MCALTLPFFSSATQGQDWVMLELQGGVETVGNAPFDGGQLGTMTVDKGGAPVLEIGHHQIKGKEVKLKLPYAVLKKVEGKDTETGTTTSYDVVAIVRKKIIFQTRPHSLIGTAKQGLSTVLKG
jgi:chromosome transmission fidelity protein 8